MVRMIAGCAAALSSETGRIGFLVPLINDETRRLVSAAYLGARYCWQTYRDRNPEDLNFRVTWIGFWFNIPGVTLEPTKVADDFYNSGYDVVMTGIDTPEAAVQAKKAADSGKNVKFLHYTLRSGCNLAPDVCVGVPTYNWGPSYLKLIQDAQAGNFQSQFIWYRSRLARYQ
uniref:BMP family lipoprotein n=1 Tax=Desertifilum tharense IPPAS B-1220 TaxID=1781255 RepID=A0ACD5GUY3_9CYAN